MSYLFSEINNCYNLRYLEVSLKYKKKYIFLLKKLVDLNLIKYFKIKKNYIYIYLKYYNNKPLFYLTNNYQRSNLKYYNLKNLKKNHSNSLNLYTTSYGILTFEEMIIKNMGGKLLVTINFNGKNIM